MAFDFHKAHTYSVQELFGFINSGEVTFPELQQLGIHYSVQQQLKTLIDSQEEVAQKEAADWQNASGSAMQFENFKNYRGAINAYNNYLKIWEQEQFHPQPLHLQMGRDEISRLQDLIEGARVVLKNDLLEDMRKRPDKYSPVIMRYILGLIMPNPEELDNSPAGKFLAAGLSLSMNELVDGGVLPDDPCLMTSITKDVWSVPQLQMKELGAFPADRNDVFFMGVKGSGKTCALAGIINELYRSGEVTYQPQINDFGQDLCQEYYYDLIKAVRNNKALAPTATDTICFMKLDVGKKREKELTMVEMSGEAFSSLSQAYSARDVWEHMGASSCLGNNNDKVLCFLVDYSRVVDGGRQDEQDLALDKAVTVLANDGPNPNNPGKGCTLSKVRTVAIVVTKSDLMGPELSYEQREKIAKQYILENLSAFVGTLKMECQKHNINAPAHNQVYVFPFSLGDFYVGQTLQFKNEDSARFIGFLKDATNSRRRTIAGLFNL